MRPLTAQIQAELERIRTRAKNDLDLAILAEKGIQQQVAIQEQEVNKVTEKADQLVLLRGRSAVKPRDLSGSVLKTGRGKCYRRNEGFEHYACKSCPDSLSSIFPKRKMRLVRLASRSCLRADCRASYGTTLTIRFANLEQVEHVSDSASHRSNSGFYTEARSR